MRASLAWLAALVLPFGACTKPRFAPYDAGDASDAVVDADANAADADAPVDATDVSETGDGSCTPTTERCNGVDDDCNGEIDEDFSECVGTNAAPSCIAGQCHQTCTSGHDDCDDSLANGCETALGTDANCGACGDDCVTGWGCSGGVCTCATATLSACAMRADAIGDGCVDDLDLAISSDVDLDGDEDDCDRARKRCVLLRPSDANCCTSSCGACPDPSGEPCTTELDCVSPVDRDPTCDL